MTNSTQNRNLSTLGRQIMAAKLVRLFGPGTIAN